MDHLIVPVTPPSSRARKFRRLSLRVLIALLCILIVLAVDFSPTVTERPAPTAQQVVLVRQQVEQIRSQLRGNAGQASIRLTEADLASASVLISALEKFGQVDASIVDKAVILRSSKQYGVFWLNMQVDIAPNPAGFPPANLRIGDLRLGSRLSRWVIGGVIDVARRRGVDVPPLHDLVRSVRLDTTSVQVAIRMPLSGAFAKDISSFGSQPVDAALTAAIYCRLVSDNRTTQTTDLAVHVRRAFGSRSSQYPIVAQNRAAFVALAMYTTSLDAGRLAGDATQRARKCRGQSGGVVLAGRTDLANHWALSAALAVALGADVGRAMGEWKELSDSRPGGSGFSFVDLAADRAGLAFARLASDPQTANETALNLSAATAEYLLPVRALALAEGLTERQFVSQFQTVDSLKFNAAKSRIDAVLAKKRAPLP